MAKLTKKQKQVAELQTNDESQASDEQAGLLSGDPTDEQEKEKPREVATGFKGKIAKSYQDSEEWWPSSPKPPPGTKNEAISTTAESRKI